jgi:hypothetical protein
VKLSHRITAATFACLLIAVGAEAQRGRGSGGWRADGAYCRMYDPKTVETITGEIQSIEQFVPAEGMSAGIHLSVKTEGGTVSVHLGPAWWLERQDVQLQTGDEVEVRGSRITFQGRPALIAAEVRKGDYVLVLRDDDGWPAWSGWRRRPA